VSTRSTARELAADLRSEAYGAARRRALRQLAEALVFEGLLDAEEAPDGDDVVVWIRGRREDGSEVAYECRGRRLGSFGRLCFTDGPVMRPAPGGPEAVSVPGFLGDVGRAAGAAAEEIVRMGDELERTVLNDTLARRHSNGPDLDDAGLDDLESGVIEGHPYHPCYKSRIGFDHADNLRYGPEFGHRVRPLWVAARAASAVCAASRSVVPSAFVRAQLGEQVPARFDDLLSEQGAAPEDFVLIPMHPWQWREVVVPGFLDDLAGGRLVPLGEGYEYRPQQSVRTLADATDPAGATLKLSLGILATSTARGLAPHTVRNAPLVSDWLADIFATDAYLRDDLRTIMLGEVLGVAYEGSPQPATPPGMVSCIWRESVHPKLHPGEKVVPFTALAAAGRHGAPLIAPWIARYGAERWLSRVLEVAVRPVLHLLVSHGIALEAHAQNLLLVHRDGMPERLVLRDFHDGVRFSRAHLKEPGRCPALHGSPPGHLAANRTSYLETDDPTEVRDFVHDAFFFVNLSELARCCAASLGVAEARFWSLARDVVEAYRAAVPDAGDRFGLFDVLAPTVRVERLAGRRLWPQLAEYTHEVPNPLACAGGRP
jgi:siderophore synthetase component